MTKSCWALPEKADVGDRLNAPAGLMENANSRLVGVRSRSDNPFTSPLLKELLQSISEIHQELEAMIAANVAGILEV